MTTQIVLCTHTLNPGVQKLVAKLSRELEGRYPFAVVYDRNALNLETDPGSLPGVATRGYRFDDFGLRNQVLKPGSPATGNLHFVFFWLLEQFPEADYIWFVEFDVRYSGNWARFFDTFEGNDAALLAAHLRTYADEPDWSWWKRLERSGEFPSDIVEQCLIGFFPICRFSRDGLLFLREEIVRDRWVGHYESLCPSLLHKNGYRIEEIGGRSPFTPAERRGRFYLSSTTLLRNTHRWRPPLLLWGHFPNHLYHPIKPWKKTFRERRKQFLKEQKKRWKQLRKRILSFVRPPRGRAEPRQD